MAVSKKGWRVGRNPPSVLCGIRLIGLPAPSGRFFIGVCLPFPLAGQPFHRFTPSILNIMHASSSSAWVDVSFLLCSQGSRPAPLRTLQFYTWAEFPQTLHIRGPKATHQLTSPHKRGTRKAIRITQPQVQPIFAYGSSHTDSLYRFSYDFSATS